MDEKVYLDVGGGFDFLERQFISIVEQQEHQGLEQGDLKLFRRLREVSFHNTQAERGLPLQFAARMFAQIKLFERLLKIDHFGW